MKQKSRTFKKRWWWIIVEFGHVTDLHVGIALMDHLITSQVVEKGYYCRYTDKRPRIEIKCLTDRSQTDIRDSIKSACTLCGYVLPRKIKFNSFVGSDAHALATFVVLTLSEQNHLKDASVLRDVIHWMYNMCGFSYAQELESSLQQAHLCFTNLLGGNWRPEPYFKNPKFKVR